jgi:hypothetical protein
MKRPWDLSRRELEDIVEALQEAFYLDVDDAGDNVWDPDSEVPGADLVETMDFHLEAHGLKPERVIPEARLDAHDLVRRLVAWADRMGGWEAEVWDEAREFLEREPGKISGGCPSTKVEGSDDADSEGTDGGTPDEQHRLN